MTREEARAALARLAAGVREESEDLAVGRLLERISAHDESEALRDALTEVGARALLRQAVAS